MSLLKTEQHIVSTPCLTESESDYSGISSLSSVSKQVEVKNMSSSATASASRESEVSRKAQPVPLKTESKNHAKKGLKRRADEGSQSDGSDKAQTKLESQREYNRVSAARARKRQKDRITDLEEKVKDASYEVNEHQKSNDVLRAQFDMLFEQNQLLLAERDPDPPTPAAVPPALAQPAAQARLPPMLEGIPVEQLLQIIGALQKVQS
jgi:hypothetical protein